MARSSKSKSQSRTRSRRTSGLKTIKIKDSTTAKQYRPKEEKRLVPKVWELPNRKTFFNWSLNTYSVYNASLNKKPKKIGIKGGKFEFFSHQKLVRDFMQNQSPYRGILLFHGLGVGKTCAAIAIAESLRQKKEVWMFSKASLESNFFNDLKLCGFDTFRSYNHWVWSSCTTETERELAKEYGIPDHVISKNGGAFLIDYSKTDSNYSSLSSYQQEKLDYQIEELIRNRYKFKHLDDTRLLSKLGKFPFDDKILIFDEVHNLINSMSNKSKTGKAFEDLLMNARNTKLIFLTGTPLINDVFESTKIFNILRGPIETFVFRIVNDMYQDINWSMIRMVMKKNMYIDQLVFLKNQKLIKVTKNPSNFVNSPDGKGIVYSEGKTINNDRFQELIKKQLQGLGYRVISYVDINTALPPDIKDFDRLFYNRELNKLRKVDVIKKRIMGLSSFYDPVDKSLMPEVTKKEIVSVPMSDYQSAQYQEVRNKEIEKNKKMKMHATRDVDKIKSSYRIFSRMHCTFVFPEETGSPYNKDSSLILESLEDELDQLDMDLEEGNLKKIRDFDRQVKMTFLAELDKNKHKYLSLENGSLAKHSPKYKAMIENIEKSKGSVFVYSQFITLIGLNTFCLALEATKKYAPFRLKKVGGQYHLNEDLDDYDKYKYIIWAGDIKDKQERDILKKVFNSDFDNLPASCSELKKELIERYGDEQNLRGKIAKIFLTTKTGAEGISLFNVRQVHVMEPYWQPVLVDQVIGRAIRTGSHLRLPPEDRNVEVYIYMASYTPQQVRNMTGTNLRSDIARFSDGLNKKGQIVTSDESLFIISERKKRVINDFLKLIKESAFDCNLLSADNFSMDDPFTCLDYDSKNRDDYLYAPGIMDTVDIVEENQEQDINVKYAGFKNAKDGKTYYYEVNPAPGLKRYIYDENIKKAGRPKPVGELIEKNGKLLPGFYKKKDDKKDDKKNNKKKSQSKSKGSQKKSKGKSMSKKRSQKKSQSKSRKSSKSKK